MPRTSKKPKQETVIPKIPDTLEEIISELVSAQGIRRFAIRQQIRTENATLDFIRRSLGFSTYIVDEGVRKDFVKRARAIRKAFAEGEELPEPIKFDVFKIMIAGESSRGHWDKMRADTEAYMEALAAKTPGAAFVAKTSGFGLKGLAVIIGEAGNLSNYRKKAQLWTRLGLGVRDGKRQGSVPIGLSREERAETWSGRKYNPHRRAEVYAFIDDTMFKHQKPGTRYRDYYDLKKAEYTARKVHYADKCARRAMAKLVIGRLHAAWRAADGIERPVPIKAAA